MADQFVNSIQRIIWWLAPFIGGIFLAGVILWGMAYRTPPIDPVTDTEWTKENCDAIGNMVLQARDEKGIATIYDCPDDKMRIR